jgi:hypothetical protein
MARPVGSGRHCEVLDVIASHGRKVGLMPTLQQLAVEVGGLVAAAALLTVAVGAPAAAARPEVHQSSCAQAGGAFSRDHGVKTCSVTRAEVTDGPLIVKRIAGGILKEFRDGQWYGGIAGFEGSSYRRTEVATVVARSQHGAGPVTTDTSTYVVHSEVVPLSCARWVYLAGLGETSAPHELSACAALGLYGA